MKTLYAGGLAFNPDKTKVALILKNRPTFLAGLYNIIGGHVESTDSDYKVAMSREFEEEAGVHVEPEDWKHISTVNTETYELYVYSVVLPDALFNDIRTMEEEIVEVFYVSDVPYLPLAPDVIHFLNVALYG